MQVTNLEASGSGSLREAIEAKGPRIIVFRTGGTIELKNYIVLKNPYVTIAGQTAPGDGISIRGAHIRLESHDVIVRGLRFRIGDEENDAVPYEGRDGLSTESFSETIPRNIIVDHCSVAWAIDENMSTWGGIGEDPGVLNVTYQWCIVAEGLHRSHHPFGPHSKGLLVGNGSHYISVHHNLFAHNDCRNPMLKANTVSDVVNNVVYNWGRLATHTSDAEAYGFGIRTNIVNNYYIAGADSTGYEIDFRLDTPAESKVYVAGNIGPHRPNDTLPEYALCGKQGSVFVVGKALPNSRPVTTWAAPAASKIVLEHAGAVSPHRDPVDARIVQSVRDMTGRIIDSQAEVGGWPVIDPGVAPVDSDSDGIPDAWEKARGLNPDDASDAVTSSPMGYDWIEVYLNSLVPVPGNAPPVVSAGEDQHVALNTVVTLSGSAQDDGIPALPTPMRTVWHQESGPANARFSDETVLAPSIELGVAGVYVFELRADDYDLQASDTVTVEVGGQERARTPK